jgi:hypothetical protein
VWTQGLNEGGVLEVAFRETYYNDAFPWADDGTIDIDVAAVAIHETGYALSQAHFGKIFGTPLQWDCPLRPPGGHGRFLLRGKAFVGPDGQRRPLLQLAR